ncbi:hypothetical protein P691DRAFT_768994 [Macrolepiota fuliginosa MF-IS2]|uniref:Uncharacterized protein n=1 Tax=Macrolepiota fuliginosa MF-IS2 TaxID=1400762 RepID=A0A9P5WVY3_9AGAR|nr:hypothetical protein P691DRAFT_768994 [Macrolepiota fuliginosa MF-IS2]
MARKKKSSNVPSTGFTPSNATCCYLNMMKQDLHVKSIIQIKHLKTVPLALCLSILDDLVAMGFKLPPDNEPGPTSTPAESNDAPCMIYQMWPKVEPLKLSNQALQEICDWFRPNFFQHSNVEECDIFTIHICNLVNVLDLIIPPQSPSPTPCACPHCDKDIPMEPPAPTCVLSEAATQTPVPVHMEAMPPPLPPCPCSHLACCWCFFFCWSSWLAVIVTLTQS